MRGAMLLIILVTVAFANASLRSLHQKKTDYMPWSLTTCGGNGAIQVIGSSVTPSPVIPTQNVSVTAKVKIATTLTSSNAGKVTLSIDKHVGFWVPIPCETTGTCNIDNFCTAGGPPNPKVCNLLKPLGIPCSCPIPAGTYSVSSLSINVPQLPPSLDWLANGSYRITANLYDNTGTLLWCAQVIDSIKAS